MAFRAPAETGTGHFRAEINITPLVDVVLVLLIIFMVVAPLTLDQIEVEVPGATELSKAPPAAGAMLVELRADGTILVAGEVVSEDGLLDRVRASIGVSADKLVFFDVDDDASYGAAIRVMDRCRGVGAKALGIVTR